MSTSLKHNLTSAYLDAARKGVRVGITWRNSRPACMADIIMANRRIAMRKIRQVLRLALEAGAIVRKGFAASKEITHKGTADLVTQYDVATEQFIIEKGQINQRTFGYSTRKYATR